MPRHHHFIYQKLNNVIELIIVVFGRVRWQIPIQLGECINQLSCSCSSVVTWACYSNTLELGVTCLLRSDVLLLITGLIKCKVMVRFARIWELKNADTDVVYELHFVVIWQLSAAWILNFLVLVLAFTWNSITHLHIRKSQQRSIPDRRID